MAQARDERESVQVGRAHHVPGDACGADDPGEACEQLVVHTINPFSDALAAV
jgi:hypothetical protein